MITLQHFSLVAYLRVFLVDRKVKRLDHSRVLKSKPKERDEKSWKWKKDVAKKTFWVIGKLLTFYPIRFFFSRQCLSHLLRLLSSIPFLFVPKAAEPVWMMSCSCVLFVSEKSAVDTSVQHASTEKLDGLVQTSALYFVDLVLKAVVVFPPFPWHGAFALLLLTVLSVFRDDGRDKLTFPPWNSRVVN